MTKVLVSYSAILMLLFACAGMQQPEDMKPQDLAIWANRIYVQEYDSYQRRASKPYISTNEKILLRTRYDTLTELHAVLDIYNGIILEGDRPSMALNNNLINLAYRLTEGM